jgi:hypothetical protein
MGWRGVAIMDKKDAIAGLRILQVVFTDNRAIKFLM